MNKIILLHFLYFITSCSLLIDQPKIGFDYVSIDRSFGNNGSIVTSIRSGDDYVYGMTISNDGKILIAGESYNGSIYEGYLLQYNENGSIDTSFADNGVFIYNNAGKSSSFGSVCYSPEGGIYAAGSSSGRAIIVKMTPSGILDTSFNSTGIINFSVGTTSDWFNVMKYHKGKLYAAGTVKNGTLYDNFIVRYNTDGTPDTTFGSNGIVTYDVGVNDGAIDISFYDNDNIVFMGETFISLLLPDGSLNTSFGTNGSQIDSDSTLRRVVVAPDNTIVAGGSYYSGSGYTKWRLISFKPDGSINTLFNQTGSLIIDFDEDNYLSSMQYDNGKIVIGGHLGSYYDFQYSRNYSMARISESGNPDSSFVANDEYGVFPFISENSDQDYEQLFPGSFMTVISEDHRDQVSGVSFLKQNDKYYISCGMFRCSSCFYWDINLIRFIVP